MQAARCAVSTPASGRPAVMVSSSGSAAVHSSVTRGQRGENGQPGGRLTSDGGWPSIGTSGCFSCASTRGIEPSSPRV